MLFALSSPVWLGGLALGAEVGAWHYYQQKLQATADTLAFSIAARVGTGPAQTELNILAAQILTMNQFDFSKGTWEAALSTSPRESVFVDGNSVNVRLTRTVKRLLSGIFMPGDFTIQVSAAAQVNQATEGCILGLGLPAFNRRGIEFTDAANVQVNGCEVLSNSQFIVWGGSRLAADCARSQSTFSTPGTLSVACPNGPFIEAGLTLDPYVDLEDLDLEQVAPTTCSLPGRTDIGPGDNWADKLPTRVVNGRTYALVCGETDLWVTGPGTVTIPTNWTLIFEGSEFNLSDGTNLSGTNVSFYFVDGGSPVIQAPNSRVTLTADTSGMLFRGARANTSSNPSQITVGPGSDLQGAVYFPSSGVEFQASGNFNGCPQIIGETVALRGTWRLDGPCTAPGILPIVASRVTKLTQ